MNKDVLLIIDMQPFFTASNFLRVKNGCKKQIRESIRKEEKIIVCEIVFDILGEECYNETQSDIIECLHGYKNWHLVYGKEDDKSNEVLKFLDKKTNFIKICGVNLDCCVKKTCLSLSKEHKIKIIKNSCGNYNRKYNWNQFSNLKNIFLE